MPWKRAPPRWLQRLSLGAVPVKQDGAGPETASQQLEHSKDRLFSSTPSRSSRSADLRIPPALPDTREQSSIPSTALSPFQLAPWDDEADSVGSLPAFTADTLSLSASPPAAAAPLLSSLLPSPASVKELSHITKCSMLRPTAPAFTSPLCSFTNNVSHTTPPPVSEPVPSFIALQPSLCSLPALAQVPSSPSVQAVSECLTVDGHSDTLHIPDTPLTSSSLEKILSSFQASFLAGLDRIALSIQSSVRAVEERVLLAEIKLGELSTLHNSLAATCRKLEEEASHLKSKTVNLEDYNRRNNLKFRGISEDIPPSDLTSYIQRLIKNVLPTFTNRDLVIDWVRRVPRPKNLPHDIPRDVIARLHFLHAKTAFLTNTRRMAKLPGDYHTVSVYSDLSPGTLRWRRSFADFTKVLRGNSIPYKWNNYVHLTVLQGDQKHVITTPEEGMRLLRSWHLLSG